MAHSLSHAACIAAAALLLVAPACKDAASSGENPTPTVLALSPKAAAAGSADVTLSVTGSGFVQGSVVRWNGDGVPTQYVSHTQLTATVPAAKLAVAGVSFVTVFNPAPGGGASGTAGFEVSNPVPAITSFTPQQTLVGASTLEVTLSGTGFVPGSVVHLNGSARPTVLLATGQLRVTLGASDLGTAGTFQLTVANPLPGGGTSNAATLVVMNPVPAVSLLSSYGAKAGGPGYTLWVYGSAFAADAVVRWNGANLATSRVSPTRLAASVFASDVATPGAAQVTVFNPGPGGGTSAAQTVQVRAVAPAATLDLKTLDLPVQDVAWSAATGRLYVSLPGSSPQYANSVAAVDPATGGVTGSVAVGSEPSMLVPARDGSLLYVALDGPGTVRRVTLAPLAAGLEFATGRVEEMETMPGNAAALAVSQMNPGTSPRHLGVCLYVDGVPRSRCTQGHTGSNSIEFGETGSVMYGYNNETTEFGFRTIDVLSDGLQEVQVSGGLISWFYARIHYASGQVYSNHGEVVDADRHVVLGRFESGLVSDMLPDPALGRVFAVTGDGTLTAWDMNTYAALGSITLPGFTDDHPALRRVRIVRWSADGLAVSDGHRLYIVRTTLAAP